VLDALTHVITLQYWLDNYSSHPGWGKDSRQARAIAILLRDHLRSDQLGETCKRVHSKPLRVSPKRFCRNCSPRRTACRRLEAAPVLQALAVNGVLAPSNGGKQGPPSDEKPVPHAWKTIAGDSRPESADRGPGDSPEDGTSAPALLRTTSLFRLECVCRRTEPDLAVPNEIYPNTAGAAHPKKPSTLAAPRGCRTRRKRGTAGQW
jgi:hypothetical protein